MDEDEPDLGVLACRMEDARFVNALWSGPKTHVRPAAVSRASSAHALLGDPVLLERVSRGVFGHGTAGGDRELDGDGRARRSDRDAGSPDARSNCRAQSATGRVSIGDNFFAPDTITVTIGSTVVWQVTHGDAMHDVVASDGSFRSNSAMNRGDRFSFTFTKAGEYAYICSYHTDDGEIVVQ